VSQVLVDERDVVLCDALRRAPGECVVGVVGKAHAAGIVRLWERDLTDELPAALVTPGPPLAPLVGGAAALVGVPVLAYRSRAARLAIGGGLLAAGAGAGWLVHALRDRLRFFQQSQAALQREAAGGTAT
jgi:hypothetical protein